jgi:UDP-2,3-diacylglucosamine pyrophosphatase LpxH
VPTKIESLAFLHNTGLINMYLYYHQHFPLYRKNEKKCTGIDAPPHEQQNQENRPKWEVISQEATTLLLESFEPRLVLSGHTHHGCYLIHDGGTPELTIPSFSWRNRNNPSFVMVS